MAVTGNARAAYGRAAEELAAEAAQVLGGRRSPGWLAGFAADVGDRAVALAAIRILNVEVLSAHLLAATPLSPSDVKVLRQALDAFPLVDTPGADGMAEWVRRGRDWAVVQLAGACGADLDPPGHMIEIPAPRLPEGAQTADWPVWSRAPAALAALAVPGLDSPLHHCAATGTLALARGATRAVLRRDFATAAALTRWLALRDHEPPDYGTSPLETKLLVEHIAACGGAARTVLHTRFAAHLLRRHTRQP